MKRTVLGPTRCDIAWRILRDAQAHVGTANPDAWLMLHHALTDLYHSADHIALFAAETY